MSDRKVEAADALDKWLERGRFLRFLEGAAEAAIVVGDDAGHRNTESRWAYKNVDGA